MAKNPVSRHSAEIPLLVVGTLIVVTAIPTLAVLIFDSYGIWWTFAFLLAFFSLYLARGFLNAYERASSVLITDRQFPDVYARIVHFAGEFGLEDVPDAYMVQEGGTLNAFASKHNRKNFIRINSDIFEVGQFALGPRPRDPDALDFIIAHEVGHVAANHVTYWYTFISSFIFYIPFVGSALSRAKEYTADNHGFAVVPDGIQGIVLLSGGKYLYPEIDDQQFVERAKTDKGVFVWFVNALSSHPIITKRLAALHDRSRPGKLF
jgi:Zn-dependent protease with chaperone function